MRTDLARLIVRHRDVSPMVSALLAGTKAAVTIRDVEENVILRREAADGPAGGADGATAATAPTDRFPISNGMEVVGSVEGGSIARVVAAVLSYAAAREADKRSLSQEALDRYRELNLIYDLADSIGGALSVEAVAGVAAEEAGRLPVGGRGVVLLLGDDDRDGALLRPVAGDALGETRLGEGIVGSVAANGVAEEVNDVAADPRATASERAAASLMAAPLRVRGRTLGVVATISAESVTYRAGDLKLLAAIAALAGPAIDQAANHESAMRELRRLRVG